MNPNAYLRQPAIRGELLAFVTEDDLWLGTVQGSRPHRLTSGQTDTTHPRFSPDGRWIAFSSTSDGAREVMILPVAGGEPRRLTHLGVDSWVVGWTPDGRIVFASRTGGPFLKVTSLFTVAAEGGTVTRLPWGPARTVAYGAKGEVALGTYLDDIAAWKRYRGGRAGFLWLDPEGRGEFRRFSTGGNMSSPMFVGDRLHFLSDHEGSGDLWSCRSDGSDLRRVTEPGAFYVRHPTTDGRRIVYASGGDLFVCDPASGRSERLPVGIQGPRPQASRRYVDIGAAMESVVLSPDGASVLVTARGVTHVMGVFEGPVLPIGQAAMPGRQRLARFLGDGKRIVLLSDEGGEERIEVHAADGSGRLQRWGELDIGRAHAFLAAPDGRRVAVANHRHELVVVDLESGVAKIVATSVYGRVEGVAWSADSHWLAYGIPVSTSGCSIRLWDSRADATTAVTDGWYRDSDPAFDPDGRFLYFLSRREFDPVFDQQTFNYGFPQGGRPYLCTLRKGLASPFVGPIEPVSTPPSFDVDTEDIAERVVPFPGPESRYTRIDGIPGFALFTSVPPEGMLKAPFPAGAPPASGRLSMWNFAERKLSTVTRGVSDYQVDRAGKQLLVQSRLRFKLGKAGVSWEGQPSGGRSGGYGPDVGRETGVLDLGRVRVALHPQREWAQMLEENRRLMRDHFWDRGLEEATWDKVVAGFRPLVERAATRAELSDILWEVQGALGTSHAYEMGGDLRMPPPYRVGSLAADFALDEATGAWRITGVVRGEPGDVERRSPLCAPGVDLRAGDFVIAIDGVPLSRDRSVGAALVHRAGAEIRLTVLRAGASTPTHVVVRTLMDDVGARYREWILSNRRAVQERSGGRLGYIHIPDMGPPGFAEFHRDYARECEREGLLVDVRYNRGGHVSQLLLEKIARTRLGYVLPRHGVPESIPSEAPWGPMACITNEWAGSDGDIVSHTFRMRKLGPVVGVRTWGGTVGIWPRHALVDGTVTTQPEFLIWFKDIGAGLENHGAEPTDWVDFRPQDYAAGIDPQLSKGMELVLADLERRPSRFPDFGVSGRQA